jgi:hypothetical protein
VRKHFGTAAISTFVSYLLLTWNVEAQILPYRAALQVRLVWMNVEYGNPDVRGQAIVFRGEPLIVNIGVLNRYEGAPAGAELDWPTRIVTRWWKGGRFESKTKEPLALQCEPKNRTSEGVTTVKGYVELAPHGSQFTRCKVRDQEVAALTAGSYTITAEWAAGPGGPEFREEKGVVESPGLLAGAIEFELRDVATAHDELDFMNHLAAHALLAGDFTRAVEIADEVLKRQGPSATALSTRAKAFAARGMCRQAFADWERSAAVLESNNDVGNHAVEGLSRDERGRTAALWRQQMRAILKCE